MPQHGYTPLHLAVSNGHAAVVEKLLAMGANTEAKDKVRRVGVTDFDSKGSRVNTQLLVPSSLSGWSCFSH